MEFASKQKWLRLSAQKARLVANEVRGMDVQLAIDTLKFMPQKAALLISKAVRSALANARDYKGEDKPDVDQLYIRFISVDEGPTIRRMKARAYGRANRKRRRTSHITVVLAERTAEELARSRRAAAARRVRVAPPKGGPGAVAEKPAAKKAPVKKRALFGRDRKGDEGAARAEAQDKKKGKTSGTQGKKEKGGDAKKG